MPETGPNFVAVLTPSGRGAVATIALAGPQALPLAQQRLKRANGQPLLAQQPGQIYLAKFSGAVAAAEELVVVVYSDLQVELHSHGGTAAVESVVAAFVADGCQPLTWQEWQKLQAPNPITLAADLALAVAPTEKAAQILLDQRAGALAATFAQIAAYQTIGNHSAARRLCQRLLDLAPVGLHLVTPWKVTIAGRPNVGKSSLLNAWLGYTRSIVFDQPGTTRDILKGQTALDGWPVELADTAGLRESTDRLETLGINLAKEQILKGDLVLLVFDGSCGWTMADQLLLDEMGPTSGPAAPFKILLVQNKSDLPPNGPAPPTEFPVCQISAQNQTGLNELGQQVIQQLIPHGPEPREALPFTVAQVEHLLEIVKKS